MSSTNIPYSDNESDNDDDVNNDSVTQPLLLQSSTPTTTVANGSTATIKIPTSAVIVPINKSNGAKNTTNHQNTNGNENRVCAKLSHFMNIRFNRTEQHNRRSHRDKWSRIQIGLFTISFVSVIYLCVSLNLNVDSKPSPQIIVDVPPVDPDLLGTKVPADDSHPNVIPFIPTQTHGPPSKNDVPFRTNETTSFARNHASPQPLPSSPSLSFTSTSSPSLSSSSSLALSQSSLLPPPLLPPAPPPPLSSLSLPSSMLSMAPMPTSLSTTTTSIPSENHSVQEGFLVWSPSCQIPATNPLAADVMKLFRREKYEACSLSEAVTRIEMNWTTSEATLVYNNTPKWYSVFVKTTCCYSQITRAGSGKKADDQFKLSSCTKFNETIKLPPAVEFIFVKCVSIGKTVYKNTHAIIRDRPNVRKRLTEYKEKFNNNRPLSVLMLSIDSVSRLNLIRAMPKTAQHLYDSGWFELQGYNKIDDNTFPNLMAILTGYNHSLAYDVCHPEQVGKLDKCPFIWNDFHENGYVTSYGEDETSISSFNYNKKGFLKPPTDYYLRPYMLAAEKHLPTKKKHSLTFCLGNKHSADHIYDYAMDFATHYKKDASFGLYWTNTFSHNDISDPSSMDQKMNDYVRNLDARGILNESMVVFFSDHGLRFGPVRHLMTGWLEERLPFIFIWLPEWFQNEYPEIVQALKINRNRLTNPYDLHMTLKHVLQLSNPELVYTPPTSCQNCQSLFTEVPWNRSCEETSIAAHWCTCAPYRAHDKNDKIVHEIVKFVLDGINRNLKNFTHDDHKHPLCAELKLKKLSDVRKAEYRNGNDKYDDYLLKFSVSPSDGWFETTVRHRPGHGGFEVTGSVSRLDSYGGQGHCMKIDYMRKYCYCTGITNNSKYKKG